MSPKDSETYFDDPADNAEEQPVAVKEGEEQPEETPVPEEGAEGEAKKEEKSPLEGTPFKSVEELTRAYKELQSFSTRRNQEFAEMQGMLKQMIPNLTRSQQQEIKDDPDAFMKEFVSNPKGTLLNLVKEAQKESVEPIGGKLARLETQVELNNFLGKHPELTEDDIDEMVKIINSYPEIKNRPDRLDVYLKLLKHDKPDIGQRMTQQKVGLEKGASDAKTAATLGGKKSSTPKQPEGDEFDDILATWRERQAKWNR
jgi:hypothetical protein